MFADRSHIAREEDTSWQKRWAIGAFFVYVFFVFFGTSRPFPDVNVAPENVATSNYLNQLLSVLFLISFVTLSSKLSEVRAFVQRERYLTALMLWALLSVGWSDFSMVSLKRWIGLFGEFVICLAVCLHYRWSDDALRVFRIVLFIYIPLSMLAVLVVPAATQWEFPAWRGLAPTKNNLGQITLFAIVIWIAVIRFHRGKAINAVHYAVLGLTLILFIGARSTTSFLILFVLIGLLMSTLLAGWLNDEFMARFYAIAVITWVVGTLAAIAVGAPEWVEAFFGLFGKDLTFTGRVDLWQTVLAMTEGKLWTGWGVGGFWVMDSAHLEPLFAQFPWIPNQAHQGYIDIANQLGLVGFGLLAMMIVRYLRTMTRMRRRQLWRWLFFAILVLNLQESVFFRPRHIGHFMFLFAYVSLFTDAIKEEQGTPTVRPRRSSRSAAGRARGFAFQRRHHERFN